jgi:hypothetical protein
MDLFRYSRGIYGGQQLIGASWELLPWFFAAGVAFVVIHALYKVFLGSRGAMAAGRLNDH